MKKMKRRIAGIVLILMLVTIVLSPASFSAWADKTDEDSEIIYIEESEEVIADESETAGEDEEFDISCIIDSAGVVAEETDDAGKNEIKSFDEICSCKTGDIVRFGKYEQDGNDENGKEDIEWQVLKAESDRVLLVSKYALDCVPYNTEEGDETWETCSLRNWLNNDFKNAAFSTEEQKKIPAVTVANESNPFYKTPGGNDTQDQIFCLSLNEIESMIGYNWYDDELMYGYSQEMIVEPTLYAVGRGAYSYKITEDNCTFLKDYGFDDSIKDCRGCWWWLRSPGFDNSNACSVDSTGLVGKTHSIRTSANRVAVRPALFVNFISLERSDEELEDPINLPQEEFEVIIDSKEDVIDEVSDEIKDDEIKDEDSSEEDDNKDTDVNPGEGEDVTDEDSSEENNAEDADVTPNEKNEITDEPGND
ncbi:MAG: hypothetical protein IJH82_09675 [Lachnospiraceae bacterium]|nr:hypothetical protein [Lachnospiraceae bacterium]